eukprot:m.367676 g.367676  ORF g.367676 m.367676 type:complete len:207 (+) comp20836_c0_seq12:272-892(+)
MSPARRWIHVLMPLLSVLVVQADECAAPAASEEETLLVNERALKSIVQCIVAARMGGTAYVRHDVVPVVARAVEEMLTATLHRMSRVHRHNDTNAVAARGGDVSIAPSPVPAVFNALAQHDLACHRKLKGTKTTAREGVRIWDTAQYRHRPSVHSQQRIGCPEFWLAGARGPAGLIPSKKLFQQYLEHSRDVDGSRLPQTQISHPQ